MIEKLQNEKISPIAVYFMIQSYDKKAFEDVLKEYSIEELTKYYDEFKGKYFSENELMQYFDGNYEKLSRDLALFFAPFLPEDFVISKDLEKLRVKLKSLYGEEIASAIEKALEILSFLSYPVDLEEKEYMLKELFKIMILLSKIFEMLKV